MLVITAVAAGLAAVAGITAFLIAPGAPPSHRAPRDHGEDERPEP